MRPEIKAVLFDFDGVLVSTVEMHAWAFRTALAQVYPKITVTPGGKLHNHLNGLSTREKLRYLTREMGLPESMHARIWTAKQNLTQEAIRRSIQPDSAKTEMLSALKRLGLRLACVSNSIRPTTAAALAQAGIAPFFEVVVSNEDVPRQKPDPAPYLHAFRSLRLGPNECLAVEDAPHGVEAARKSGAHVLPVSSYRDVTFPIVWGTIRTLDNTA